VRNLVEIEAVPSAQALETRDSLRHRTGWTVDGTRCLMLSGQLAESLARDRTVEWRNPGVAFGEPPRRAVAAASDSQRSAEGTAATLLLPHQPAIKRDEKALM
jgi:hypothetical protein